MTVNDERVELVADLRRGVDCDTATLPTAADMLERDAALERWTEREGRAKDEAIAALTSRVEALENLAGRLVAWDKAWPKGRHYSSEEFMRMHDSHEGLDAVVATAQSLLTPKPSKELNTHEEPLRETVERRMPGPSSRRRRLERVATAVLAGVLPVMMQRGTISDDDEGRAVAKSVRVARKLLDLLDQQ